MARILVVGNCDPDFASLRSMLEHNFDVQISRAMFVDEACEILERVSFDLVVVNRRIFADDSDGAQLIDRMIASREWAATPVMLISNFPDAQQDAVRRGARSGFGKSALNDPATIQKLAELLPRKSTAQTECGNPPAIS